MRDAILRMHFIQNYHTRRCQVVLHLGLIHSCHIFPFSMKQDSDDQLTDLDDLQGSQDPATLQERIVRRRSSKGTLGSCVR